MTLIIGRKLTFIWSRACTFNSCRLSTILKLYRRSRVQELKIGSRNWESVLVGNLIRICKGISPRNPRFRSGINFSQRRVVREPVCVSSRSLRRLQPMNFQRRQEVAAADHSSYNLLHSTSASCCDDFWPG